MTCNHDYNTFISTFHMITASNSTESLVEGATDESDETPVTFQPQPGETVKFSLIPGKRLNSELIYSENEKQLYKKNKRLKSGAISGVCRYPNCNTKIYYDDANGVCTYKLPYEPHQHSPREKEYKRLVSLNKMKTKCTDTATIRSITAKSSAAKRIFDDVIEE